jgi:hypothetical protein
MKNRYVTIKKLYPNYLILIKHNNKLLSLYNDKTILEYIKYKKLNNLKQKHINYLILNNLEIEEIKDYKLNNKYYNYLLKANIIKVIESRL